MADEQASLTYSSGILRSGEEFAVRLGWLPLLFFFSDQCVGDMTHTETTGNSAMQSILCLAYEAR